MLGMAQKQKAGHFSTPEGSSQVVSTASWAGTFSTNVTVLESSKSVASMNSLHCGLQAAKR